MQAKGHGGGVPKELTERAEHLRPKICARVEHPFHILKNRFCHRKVRSEGLENHRAQLSNLFALANLVEPACLKHPRCAHGPQSRAKGPPSTDGRNLLGLRILDALSPLF